MKDISLMDRHEKYRYLIDNKKVCSTCKKEKRMSLFNEQDNIISENCKSCIKSNIRKQLEKDAIKQVLDILNKSGLQL